MATSLARAIPVDDVQETDPRSDFRTSAYTQPFPHPVQPHTGQTAIPFLQSVGGAGGRFVEEPIEAEVLSSEPVQPALIEVSDTQLALAPTPHLVEVDVVAMLLEDKSSAATRKAYVAGLKHFFGNDPNPAEVMAFLQLDRRSMAMSLAQYKTRMRKAGCRGAVINQRLSAVRSLLKYANNLGFCDVDPRGLVDSEKIAAYRDTSGVDVPTFIKIRKVPAKRYGAKSVRGLRDIALLDVMFELGLRRSEVCKLNVEDFSIPQKKLWIDGKGQHGQKVPMTLSPGLVKAIADYILAAGHAGDRKGPLFRNLHHNPAVAGQRLTGDGLRYLVREYGQAVGIESFAPHKIRHTSITAAALATNGNMTKVQKHSRHKKLETVAIYVDNANDAQGEVGSLLAGMVRK
jgi:integrase/recombinase XerC